MTESFSFFSLSSSFFFPLSIIYCMLHHVACPIVAPISPLPPSMQLSPPDTMSLLVPMSLVVCDCRPVRRDLAPIVAGRPCGQGPPAKVNRAVRRMLCRSGSKTPVLYHGRPGR